MGNNSDEQQQQQVIIQTNGAVHRWFGLSYASYLVYARSILQSMPLDWQEEFVKLLERIPQELETDPADSHTYNVRAIDEKGRLVHDPYNDYEKGRRRIPKKKKQEG